ncbi:MAG: sensor histidine kinase KdpD [Hyphomicrobiaceae bacterium]
MVALVPDPGQKRPSPDALLKLASKEGRGKLKIFLGMAPGVGKTYAMLAAAQSYKADGGDVIVGVIETHGRAETAELVEGLEVLPRRAVAYRNRSLMEFDLETAIARKPRLLLVDEFAHTNAPGLVHAKRYQDVEDVLRNGIDVWTTLNIQHLESLQDVVQKITGIRVRETVPDRVVENADEIVVVDLPPEELIQRLSEGKVYLPEYAQSAVGQFFKPSNLTALRELALRRTVDRVDEQMLAQLRQQGVEGPWPTSERILVCVGGDEVSETVVRTASRMASAQKADWVALHVAASDRESIDRADLKQTERALRLAERLGAETVRLSGRDLTAEILGYARRTNATQIVIGRSASGLLDRLLGRSLSRDLVDRSSGLSVLVVAPERAAKLRPLVKLPSSYHLWTAVAASTAAVLLAIGVGVGLEQITPLPNLSIVFLMAVLLSAMRFGVSAGISASILSFLAYNFFFITPRYTFTVASPHELLSLCVFLVVAFIAGSLGGRLSEQAAASRERAEATQSLFEFSRKLTATTKPDDVLWLLASQAAATVKGTSIVFLVKRGQLTLETGWPPEDQLSTSDWAAARWAHEKQEPAGQGTGTMPTARFHFRPIVGSKSTLGVLGVAGADADETFSAQVLATLRSFMEQAAIVLERMFLSDQASKAEASMESERIRSALLSSVSHDLRTPLASIVGSASALRMLGDKLSDADRQDMLAAIEEEAARLNRFVSNLLDMTKLEAGVLDLRHDLIDVGDCVASAVQRARKVFPQRTVEVVLPEGTVLTLGSASLLEQLVFNLLDNAHKYSAAGTPTRVVVSSRDSEHAIAVTDEGVGIPEDALEKVFDKFYRVALSDGRAPGTGLGLAICAAIVKGMGGSIVAESPIADGHGTRVTVKLPAAPETARDPEAAT